MYPCDLCLINRGQCGCILESWAQASAVALTLQARLSFFALVDSRPRGCLCQEMPEV